MIKKLIKEGAPQVITLAFSISALNLADNSQWASIMSITALNALLAAVDFGRSQRIIAGETNMSFSEITYAILFVGFVVTVCAVNEGVNIWGAAIISLSAVLQISMVHSASIQSQNNRDDIFQEIMIVLALLRGLCLICASSIGDPMIFAKFLVVGLLGLKIFYKKNHFGVTVDISRDGINNRSMIHRNVPLAIITFAGMMMFQLDRIYLYQTIEHNLIKPITVISMFSMGILMLATLKFRQLNFLDKSQFKVLDISLTILIVVLIGISYYLSLMTNTVLLLWFGIIMAFFSLFNYVSQVYILKDLRANNHRDRIIFNCASVLLIIVLLRSEASVSQNSILIYWSIIVFFQICYITLKIFERP